MIGNVEMLLRLTLAALLGGVVGFERERMNWAAGLRTHMLVCVGAALMMLVSEFGFEDVLARADVPPDPSRIAAQVVSGIGFLGAGSILLRKEAVRGLTTAAGLWAVAGLGLAVGCGMYTVAVGTTLIVVGILAGLKPIQQRFRLLTVVGTRSLELLAVRGAVSLGAVYREIGRHGIRAKAEVRRRSKSSPPLDVIRIVVPCVTARDFNSICKRLARMPGVLECRPTKRGNKRNET